MNRIFLFLVRALLWIPVLFGVWCLMPAAWPRHLMFEGIFIAAAGLTVYIVLGGIFVLFFGTAFDRKQRRWERGRQAAVQPRREPVLRRR